MEARVLIFSGCKILSIYWLALTFNHVSNLSFFLFPYFDGTPSSQSEAQEMQRFLLSAIPTLSYFLISVFLWFFAEKISSYAVKGQNSKEIIVKSENSNLFKVLFSVTGLFIALMALPDLVTSIYAFEHMRPIIQTSETGWSQKGVIIGEGFQFLLGIGVMVGAKGIANIVIWLRGIGR